jgi:hypothetical protein
MSTLTDNQIRQIYALQDDEQSIRKIADATHISKGKVERCLRDRKDTPRQQTIAALAQKSVVNQTKQSVFDIAAGLQMCLDETLKLLKVEFEKAGNDPENPEAISQVKLRDQVAVRAELRQLFAEARKTLEVIYNVQQFQTFINVVISVLEKHTPEARAAIFAELERSANAYGAIGIFASVNSSANATADDARDRDE